MQVNHIDLSDTLIQRQIDIEHEILSMAVCGKEPKKGHIMEHLSREMFIDKTNIELFDVISDQYQKHGIKRLDPDFLINDYQAKIYKNGVLEALLALNYDYITLNSNSLSFVFSVISNFILIISSQTIFKLHNINYFIIK